MRRMQRLTMSWWLMAACGPEAPQGGSTATDPDPSSTSASSTDTPSPSTSTTEAPTTGTPTTEISTTTDSTGAESSTTGTTSVTSTTGDSSSGESTATEGGTTGEAAPCCVAPEEPTSSVQAQTPVGTRALPWAVYSISGGECGGQRFLYLYPEASGVEAPIFEIQGVDHLEIAVSNYMGMWPSDFLGTGPAEVWAHFGGQSANITGEITISEYDSGSEDTLWCDPEVTPIVPDAHVSFTIALKADGWDIAGEVVANYCPELNKLCP
ncbi:hypothetical protein [Nannocystis bainbridge]|uniref:Uncharacterized protein n=1 Tax=Nannocystis bainbridge TaxID=2995303 RepID=A0ABT5E9W1_9BACT|nr:hypothetical protein [Nannocystis bainbridge]MDC0721667.1 hypothetical protein [Nannocystis bainbridge]